jgi:hypothetical protein
MGQSLKNVDMNQCPNLKFLPGSIARWRLDNLSVSVSTLVPAFEIPASDLAREQSYKNFFGRAWRLGGMGETSSVNLLMAFFHSAKVHIPDKS